MAFKPHASIYKVENGFTVSLEYENKESKHDFDHESREYIFPSQESAINFITEYFATF